MTATDRRVPATTALLTALALVMGLAALLAPAPAAASTLLPRPPAGFGSTPAEVVRSQRIFGGTGACSPATLSPVSIGSVSTLSGVLGELYSPVVPALNLFLKSQNLCNGLNGHPVRLLLADDQGDPSTAVAAVSRLGGQGVLAFVGSIQPLTIDAVLPTLHRLRIPVIGGDASHDTWFTSSVLFPQASGPQGVGVSYARIARDELRVTRVAHVFCLELPATCTRTETATTEAVRQLGLTLVASKQVSITAPSYTSQCLELQRKGAQAVFLTVDAASAGRFAASCRGLRPSYAPRWVVDPLLGAGNERILLASGVRGAVIPTRTVPWRSAKSPAGASFQRAIQEHGFSGATGDAASLAWTSGALLVAASAQLDPTSPRTGQLVRGLRSMRSNSLGGLTAPLTFGETRPSVPYCSFRVYMSTTGPGFAGATTGARCTGAYRTPSDPNG